MKKEKIIISCGGTGGHIFPGLEIANAIKKHTPNIDIIFVGALGKMEMQKIPRHGFPVIGLWIQGFYRKSIFKNLLLPIKLVVSLIHAFFILVYYRPIAVIGTGGFASGPIIFIASILKYNTYIQEQNACPGFTNKLLSKYVNKIFVAHNRMDNFFPNSKLFNLGNPVRQSLQRGDVFKKESRSFFKLKEDIFTVLVVGGSLGAAPINKAVSDCIESLLNHNCQIIWQTGIEDYSNYTHLESNRCVIYKFIERMDLAYNASDIVISRAGAIAIAEICFLSKASILIPSPHVTDDHQIQNAQYLQKHSACLMILENQLTENLLNSVIQLKANGVREKLGNKANKLFKYNSSIEITRVVLKDVKV